MGRPERYSVGLDSAATLASGAVYAQMLAGATKSISVHSIRVTTSSNVGGHVSLQRAFSVGMGTNCSTGVAHCALATAAEARAFAAWSTGAVTGAPTGYTSALREDILPLATGSTRTLWAEEDGPLIVEPGGAIQLMNQGSGIAGGALHVNFTWSEGPI